MFVGALLLLPKTSKSLFQFASRDETGQNIAFVVTDVIEHERMPLENFHKRAGSTVVSKTDERRGLQDGFALDHPEEMRLVFLKQCSRLRFRDCHPFLNVGPGVAVSDRQDAS